jgi:signal transduction histidine kinase
MDLHKDSSGRLMLVCIGLALLVWGVGFGFDRLLARDGVTRTEILITSNGLTGLVAGLLFYNLALKERIRREIIRDRLRIIADMNHHIRNALQVITYAAATRKDAESLELIRSSVERIEWTLREVLPGQPAVSDKSPEPERQEQVRAG